MNINAFRMMLNSLSEIGVIDGFDIEVKTPDEVIVHLKPKVSVDKIELNLVCSKTYNAINGIITHINETVTQTNLDRTQAIFVMKNIADTLNELCESELNRDANNQDKH